LEGRELRCRGLLALAAFVVIDKALEKLDHTVELGPDLTPTIAKIGDHAFDILRSLIGLFDQPFGEAVALSDDSLTLYPCNFDGGFG
jgi:hypothetical protein